MPASRLIILIAFAVIGGAATIALAYGWALTGAPIWQAAIGPLLLMARVTERIRLGPAALNPFTLHPYEIAGQIAAIGIVKGKPFAPDARMKRILSEALAVGNAAGRTRVQDLVQSLRDQESLLFELFAALGLSVQIPE